MVKPLSSNLIVQIRFNNKKVPIKLVFVAEKEVSGQLFGLGMDMKITRQPLYDSGSFCLILIDLREQYFGRLINMVPICLLLITKHR